MKTAVLGAGLMGKAIAAEFLRIGAEVVLYDIRPQTGATDVLENIADCGLVIETITEKLRAKQKLFHRVADVVRDDVLLFTNTSTISVGAIAEVLASHRRQRFCGFHFFHPVAERHLIEIIPAKETTAETVTAAETLAVQLGKKPIIVRDVSGFLVNRLLQPYLQTALELSGNGISHASIDRAAVDFGMKKGPFRLMDEIGLDVVLHSGWVLYKAFPDRVKPMPQLLQLVEGGNLGRKTGRGFYEWTGQQLPQPFTSTFPPSTLLTAMYDEALRCLADGIVSDAADIDTASVAGLGFPQDKGGIITWGRSSVLDGVTFFHGQKASWGT